MCGVVGFFTPRGFDPAPASAILRKMADAVKHRGPDDSGQWFDGAAGVALGHRRLAIIDLTAAGHQPMASQCGSFILAFNGEIYNHLELREELGDRPWRGHSDTETLLAGIEKWGLEKTLQQATGMFAIALWDRDSRTLSLARDRMGEKPLYYGWQNGTFFFTSELKALRKHPDFVGNIDRSALASYVRRGYVPTPQSIYAGISKLVPGSILQVKSAGLIGDTFQPRTYWSLAQIISIGEDRRFNAPPEEAVATLEALLLTAIRQQQVSDVPLGAFLSGGIDSSTVVALMQATSMVPVRTFTVGFQEQAYDEARHARAVAEHLKTDHTELYVSADDAMGIIPEIPVTYDEPFADSSQIPTILVSRLARRHVTVALSGDGGDELFCGYGRYSKTVHDWSRLSTLPFSVRCLLQRMLPAGPLAEGIASQNVDALYAFMNSQWKGCPDLAVGAEEAVASRVAPDSLGDAKERMMYTDAVDYLPDDILVKVDRAAMSASLETRVPFLDHRVVEFAWRLPIAIKDRHGIGKWPLKQILHKYVPEQLVARPKMGFGVPIEHWLRGPLRHWAEELLSEDRLRRDGFFDPVAIRTHWKQHVTGTRDRHYGLWTILMFQAWYEHAKTQLAT